MMWAWMASGAYRQASVRRERRARWCWGASYIGGQSKRKTQFDSKVKIAPWVFHDLRRTARSLMSRAGVRPDIAERVMGHAIRGVEGTHDRHSYREEKADALRRLAA
jgi:integrase